MASDSENDVEFEPESFQIGPYHLTLTTIAYLPLTLLASNQAKGVEISGQKLWCGSLVVIEYILNHPEYVQSNIIIELGAGTGLLGMISKLLGASGVYLTDHDIKSIEHMKNDLITNKLNDNCEVIQFDWYKVNEFDYTIFNTSPNSESAHCRLVAGDVLYKALLLTPFFQVVHRFFTIFSKSHPSNTVSMLLAHIPRNGNEHIHVIQSAQSFGLTINEINESEWRKGVVSEHAPEDDYTRAKLYMITLDAVNV